MPSGINIYTPAITLLLDDGRAVMAAYFGCSGPPSQMLPPSPPHLHDSLAVSFRLLFHLFDHLLARNFIAYRKVSFAIRTVQVFEPLHESIQDVRVNELELLELRVRKNKREGGIVIIANNSQIWVCGFIGTPRIYTASHEHSKTSHFNLVRAFHTLKRIKSLSVMNPVL